MSNDIHLTYKISLNPVGFFEVEPKPSQEQLRAYYSEKYYQTAVGSYELEYSDAERLYIRNKIDQKYRVMVSLANQQLRSHSLLDVGCGEGWSLDYFMRRGWQVSGLDFSKYGCEKFNPHCTAHLRVGDIFSEIQTLVDEGQVYDCIWLVNVLEHVVDPIDLLQKIKKLMADGGVLVIQVPNDYSAVQNVLVRDSLVSKEYWLAPPDHLSYFNADGLRAITTHAGWQERFLMSDFWIELNLFNKHSNYVENRSVGKEAHRARVAIENMLHEIAPEKAIALYQKAAEAGLGRNLVGFYSIRAD